MKAVNDLDFLSLFWAEAKAIGQRVINDLPNCATPNIGSGKQLMYIINFSDISGQSWGVREILRRIMGQSVTLKRLADKINYMILKGRANDVKPMLESIVKNGEKKLYKGRGKNSSCRVPKNESLGQGTFRVGSEVYVLNEAEIRRVKEYFNIRTNTEIRTVDWTSQKEVGVDFDYRCSVFFSAQKSKKQIYEIMNSIKANPITFLK